MIYKIEAIVGVIIAMIIGIVVAIQTFGVTTILATFGCLFFIVAIAAFWISSCK